MGLDRGGQARYMYRVASNETLPLFLLENLEEKTVWKITKSL